MIMRAEHANTPDPFPSAGSPECRLMHTENRVMEQSSDGEGLFIGVALNAASAVIVTYPTGWGRAGKATSCSSCPSVARVQSRFSVLYLKVRN